MGRGSRSTPTSSTAGKSASYGSTYSNRSVNASGPYITKVVFVGGGHSSSQVLRNLAEHRKRGALQSVDITIINDTPTGYYSGMLPGCIAGQYDEHICQISMESLAEFVGGTFICARAINIELENRVIICKKSNNNNTSSSNNDNNNNNSSSSSDIRVYYDVLCINVGSATKGSTSIPGVLEHAIITRPISKLYGKIEHFERQYFRQTFSEALLQQQQQQQQQQQKQSKNKFKSEGQAPNHSMRPPKVVVVGAGAAGVELAATIQRRFCKLGGFGLAEMGRCIALIDSHREGLCATLGVNSLADKTASALRRRHIQFISGMRVTRVEKGVLHMQPSDADGGVGTASRMVQFDMLVWSCGSEPPAFIRNISSYDRSRNTGGLEVDSRGYLKVTKTLQCVRHDNIFAAGDCISLEGHPNLPKAGVYAVRQGPILTNNILRYLQRDRGNLQEYKPQPTFLKILNLGDNTGIGEWHGYSVRGWPMWVLKNFIDTRWMNTYWMCRVSSAENESDKAQSDRDSNSEHQEQEHAPLLLSHQQQQRAGGSSASRLVTQYMQ